tara:strand:+ start:381 stop:512 length:132 start_codon:yes stop_codon:yes gene_type:complete
MTGDEQGSRVQKGEGRKAEKQRSTEEAEYSLHLTLTDKKENGH